VSSSIGIAVYKSVRESCLVIEDYLFSSLFQTQQDPTTIVHLSLNSVE
jgi:hypothetical protein